MADNEKKAEEPSFVRFNAENAHLIPAQNMPPIFVNQFHVLMDDTHTRIAFGNSVVDGVTGPYQFVLMMPTWKAEDLANLILEIRRGDDDQASKEVPNGDKIKG